MYFIQIIIIKIVIRRHDRNVIRRRRCCPRRPHFRRVSTDSRGVRGQTLVEGRKRPAAHRRRDFGLGHRVPVPILRRERHG